MGGPQKAGVCGSARLRRVPLCRQHRQPVRQVASLQAQRGIRCARQARRARDGEVERSADPAPGVGHLPRVPRHGLALRGLGEGRDLPHRGWRAVRGLSRPRQRVRFSGSHEGPTGGDEGRPADAGPGTLRQLPYRKGNPRRRLETAATGSEEGLAVFAPPAADESGPRPHLWPDAGGRAGEGTKIRRRHGMRQVPPRTGSRQPVERLAHEPARGCMGRARHSQGQGDRFRQGHRRPSGQRGVLEVSHHHTKRRPPGRLFSRRGCGLRGLPWRGQRLHGRRNHAGQALGEGRGPANADSGNLHALPPGPRREV